MGKEWRKGRVRRRTDQLFFFPPENKNKKRSLGTLFVPRYSCCLLCVCFFSLFPFLNKKIRGKK